MPRGNAFQALLRDVEKFARPFQSHEYEEEKEESNGNHIFFLHQFGPRANPPPPEISRANVRIVDIIAVHGLGSSCTTAWRADDGAIWFRNRLPQLLAEQNIEARVLSYSYKTGFAFTHMTEGIQSNAGILLNEVWQKRNWKEQIKVPIIFVAHNLGGLVVKAALKKARAEETRYRNRNFLNNAAGCVFFSVPHRAADIDHWIRNASTFSEAPKGHCGKRLGWGISGSPDEWEKIGCDFADSIPNIQIGTVYETQQTKGKVIVDEHSARLGFPGERVIGLPRSDHRNICKFGDSPDEGDRFSSLGTLVMEMVESALERAQ